MHWAYTVYSLPQDDKHLIMTTDSFSANITRIRFLAMLKHFLSDLLSC